MSLRSAMSCLQLEMSDCDGSPLGANNNIFMNSNMIISHLFFSLSMESINVILGESKWMPQFNT